MEWIIYFGLGSMCYVIHKLIASYINNNQTSDITKTTRYVWGCLITIVVFGSYIYYQSKTSIKDGELYYVNLFESKDSQKNYRVPGQIFIDDGYLLNKVFWSNGGELYFDSGYNNLVIGEKIIMEDEESKEWYVELTKEKADIPN